MSLARAGVRPAVPWTLPSLGIPALLALLAVALPVGATADWLKGSGPVSPQELRAGVWILKLALLATAGAVLVVSRLSREPVAGSSDVRESDDTVSSRGQLLLALVLATALALRLVHVNTELWLDEIESLVRYVRLGVPQILSTYDSQNQHPLYSLLAHASQSTTGGQWATRLPAVGFGVASLWATFLFARRVASRAESYLAVLFLTLSYHHVWFSQNARGYTAILFFTLVTSLLFLRLVEAPGARPHRLAWSYAAMTALAVYTHLTAALVAVGHGIALVVTALRIRRGEPASRRLAWPAIALALAALLTICLYAVVAPQVLDVLIRPTMDGTTVEWTSPRWLLAETIRVLGTGVPGAPFTVIAAAAILVIGVVDYWRQSPLVVLVMFAPVVVTSAAVLALRHNLWPRFFFFAAGFLVLAGLRGGFVVARWLFRSHGERIAVAGAVLATVLSGLTVPRAWGPKQQFVAAARYVDAQRSAGDQVVAVDVAAAVYRVYHTPPAWQFTSDVAPLTAIEDSAPRTWVVYTSDTHLRALFPELARHLEAPRYREVRVFPATVGGGEIRVLLHDSRPGQ